MKIVFLIYTLATGGAEKSLVDIAINSDYFESYFIFLYKEDKLASTLSKHGISVIGLGLNEKYGFNKAVQQILPIIKKIKPDLIHSTLFRSDIVSRKLKTYLKIPLINSFVNNSYTIDRYKKLSPLGKLKLFGVQYYDRFTASKVDFFISNSQTIRKSNAEALNINPNNIKVIYRGRNPESFSNVNTDLKFTMDFSDNDILLNVSRLLDRKGQIDLILAFAEVTKVSPKTILLIAGEGQFRSTLQKLIDRLQLGNKVFLLGNRDDVAGLLKIADIFVFPSYYEGLPGAIIEAMFSEKIIICSDIPENKECVNDKQAIFFPKGNTTILAEKILEVLVSKEAYEDLAKEAKIAAYEKFDLKGVIKQYADTYEEVINKFNK